MLLTCGAIVFCLRFGAHALTMAQLWSALTFSTAGSEDVARVIIWDIRFPRVLMGLFVGAAFATRWLIPTCLVSRAGPRWVRRLGSPSGLAR